MRIHLFRWLAQWRWGQRWLTGLALDAMTPFFPYIACWPTHGTKVYAIIGAASPFHWQACLADLQRDGVATWWPLWIRQPEASEAPEPTDAA